MQSINIVESLISLVKIPSEVTRKDGKIVRMKYHEVAETIKGLAEKHGLDVESIDILGGEIPTLFISVPAQGPTVALITHYDVIPARGPWVINGEEMDPYQPVVRDGKIYGRGAADDKSAIVAAIAALTELQDEGIALRYQPTLIVTGDEEVGGTGIREILNQGYKWDRAIILDAGSEYVSIGASGVVHGWIKVKGKAGHAGHAHLTVNAAEKMVELLYEFKQFKAKRQSKLSKFASPPGSPLPKLWGRFNITILKLGPREAEKHNRVPGETWAGFDMRLLPEEDMEQAINELYSSFSAIVAKLGVNAEIEIEGAQRGWYTKNKEFIDEVYRAAKEAYVKAGLKGKPGIAAELGGNDGTFFYQRGIDVIAFGSIRAGTNIHAQGEYVYIEDIEMLKHFIKIFLAK